MENVDWHQARSFIRALNQIEETDQYRLPTEAEWEYACRAGTTTAFSFGDDVEQLSEYAWFDENSDGEPIRVESKNPNPWGLYDMHGNVWEWVEDDWHDTYNDVPTDGSAWVDKKVKVLVA